MFEWARKRLPGLVLIRWPTIDFLPVFDAVLIWRLRRKRRIAAENLFIANQKAINECDGFCAGLIRQPP